MLHKMVIMEIGSGNSWHQGGGGTAITGSTNNYLAGGGLRWNRISWSGFHFRSILRHTNNINLLFFVEHLAVVAAVAVSTVVFQSEKVVVVVVEMVLMASSHPYSTSDGVPEVMVQNGGSGPGGPNGAGKMQYWKRSRRWRWRWWISTWYRIASYSNAIIT